MIPPNLSVIEKEVLAMYARDAKTPSEIARERHRSLSTIMTQLFRIRTKFKARNGQHLVILYWNWREPGDREFESWGRANGP